MINYWSTKFPTEGGFYFCKSLASEDSTQVVRIAGDYFLIGEESHHKNAVMKEFNEGRIQFSQRIQEPIYGK